MVNIRPPKVEKLFSSNYSLDSHNSSQYGNVQSRSTASTSDLISRIIAMKQHMDFLKNQITKERGLLHKEKQQIYKLTQDEDITQARLPNYSIYPSASRSGQAASNFQALAEHTDDRLPLSAPSKQHLKDIEQKCDAELSKLHTYIKNIKELRMHWTFLMSQHNMRDHEEYQAVNEFERRRMYEGVPSEDFMASKSVSYFMYD